VIPATFGNLQWPWKAKLEGLDFFSVDLRTYTQTWRDKEQPNFASGQKYAKGNFLQGPPPMTLRGVAASRSNNFCNLTAYKLLTYLLTYAHTVCPRRTLTRDLFAIAAILVRVNLTRAGRNIRLSFSASVYSAYIHRNKQITL